LTQRTRGHSPGKVIADLQAYLRGSINYYVIGIPFGEIRALDQWVRRRMRLYRVKGCAPRGFALNWAEPL